MGAPLLERHNDAFHLTAEQTAAGPALRLRAGAEVAAESYRWHAATAAGAATLQRATVALTPTGLTVRGDLAGLELTHTFVLSAGASPLEEHLTLRNTSGATVALQDLATGWVQAATDAAGQALPAVAADRWVAVPLRVRATDAPGHQHDFGVAELFGQPGAEPVMDENLSYRELPTHKRVAEGWVRLRGDHGLGVFSFCQQHMLFSVLETAGTDLRFGGFAMASGEPAELGRIAPGETMDLGSVHYAWVAGGYHQAAYAYRRFLDAHGCRFPANFDPPVHWEQLYDMEGAWSDRLHRYTAARVEQEALKGVAYSCEALYLDPGWDTDFGTFLWGRDWLGELKPFVAGMQARHGLKVSLHTPLATWVSHPRFAGFNMSPTWWQSWPQEARRLPPPTATHGLEVPAVRDGRRNLALLPEATAAASSTLAGYAIHQVPHLIDGWFGNSRSWIAAALPAWAEVDLGNEHRLGQVRLGNDHAAEYHDRGASKLRLLVSRDHAAWTEVATYDGEPLAGEHVFDLTPVTARWLRVELLASPHDLPRLDEIEILEAEPAPADVLAAFRPRRGPAPEATLGPQLCLGSQQWLDEAERRLLALCEGGVTFLMFDGNWWNGGCVDPHHGHPVPYLREDHMRANLDLAQRIHRRYPQVLIEMHDMLAGGSRPRPTPVYYKYGLPGSYDDNWGFELMWDPMDDLKAGRARALYYYNLGCNVPVYLHIDLRKDNRECLVLWWYASTCRHLGIGGTHADPEVVKAEQAAMRQYQQWEAYFKRGEFYGLGEDVHLHVLPQEQGVVVNLFNPSDQPKHIQAGTALADLGLAAGGTWTASEAWATVKGGRLTVDAEVPAWGARVAVVRAN